MIKNYLKIAIRQLFKNKLFSALNIFGLAISMSVCMLLIMVLVDQYSYDTFHESGDRIYRIISARHEKNIPLNRPTHASTAVSIGERLNGNYPFIEQTVRIAGIGEEFKINDKIAYTDQEGFFADQSFLEVFNFGWKKGNKQSALQEPRSIVFTESAIEQLFPEGDAMNAVVEFGELGFFTVTGIIPDPPRRSHIRFDYLISFSTVPNFTKAEQEKAAFYDFDEIWRGHVYVLLDEKEIAPSSMKRCLNWLRIIQARTSIIAIYLNLNLFTRWCPVRI